MSQREKCKPFHTSAKRSVFCIIYKKQLSKVRHGAVFQSGNEATVSGLALLLLAISDKNKVTPSSSITQHTKFHGTAFLIINTIIVYWIILFFYCTHDEPRNKKQGRGV